MHDTKYRFKNYLKKEKKFSKNTIDSYVSSVKEFIPFVEINSNNYVQAFGDYISYLTRIKKNSKTTINQKISALKAYLKFLHLQEKIDTPLLHRLQSFNYRRIGKRLPSFYDYSLLKQICLYIRNSKSLKETDKYFIYLMVNHGMTIEECLSIEFPNIFWEDRLILIRKNNGFRYIIMNKEDVFFLIRYIVSQKNKIDLYKSSFLFQVNGRPMSDHVVQKSIKKVSEKVGRKIQPRTLRNTFIMSALDAGIDIVYIKEYLGLKSFSSLTRFTYLNQTYFSDVIELQNKIRGNINSNKEELIEMEGQDRSDKLIKLFKNHSLFINAVNK